MSDRARLRGALALALAFLLAFAPGALAGPPTHPHLEAKDIEGFDHACGTAVDSKGDVYVSSAGESKVRVFGPTHTELAFISNSSQPCGLAVNSKGEVFVSERATGKVVRYKPNAYPFSGAPTYGAREEIDSSGEAKGIAVDPKDDRLFVAKGTRIAVYQASGSPEVASSEIQRISVFGFSGGTFTLSFRGKTTSPLAFNASSAQVDAALEALSTIGAGNVAVSEESASVHKVTFEAALHDKTVPQIYGDPSGLTGGNGNSGIFVSTTVQGFSGQVGEGKLTDASGVAAYTYAGGDRYLFAADAATDELQIFSGADLRQFEQRRTVAGVDQDRNPETPDQAFGFGSAGAYLAVDPGNRLVLKNGRFGEPFLTCAEPVAEQACTAGHLLLYDAAHDAVDELEAGGEFLDQVADPAFADAAPTAMAIDRSGTGSDGTIYVSAGAGPGSKVLAFGPLAQPSRALDEGRSQVFEGAGAVAVDRNGYVYASGGQAPIRIFDPAGNEIKVGPEGQGIPDGDPKNQTRDLAIDSTGKLYVMEEDSGPTVGKVTYYTPSAYPPVDGTQYTRHEPPIVTAADFGPIAEFSGISVNPSNDPAWKDHVLVTGRDSVTREYDSAAAGHDSKLLRCVACGLNLGQRESVGVYGANGNLYFGVNNNSSIWVVNAAGTEALARLSGDGCPSGRNPGNPPVAVDQSNGHVLSFSDRFPTAQELDGSGACVASFGSFTDEISRLTTVAIDNSCALHDPPLTEATTPTCKQLFPANGTVYVGFDDTAPNSFDVTAFAPLSYGEAPVAATGIASGIEAGAATLNGTVNPRGFELKGCEFEYLPETQYLSNGKTFTGASTAQCAETAAQIGKGSDPVAVHADLTGLDPEARYRFRLLAENKYGEGSGAAWPFGPPSIATKTALPVLYREATLRAEVDPAGLPTEYRFEYGKAAGQYDQITSTFALAPHDGPVAVQVPLVGLAEGTEYHFRIVVENEAKEVLGPDQSLETLQRRSGEECGNVEYRTGLSANLPDCRAYELVTPAETNGLEPYAAGGGDPGVPGDNWLVSPRGPGRGESLAYYTDGTLPGFDGNGRLDGYRASRAAGGHPAEGWSSELFGPSFEQTGPGTLHLAKQRGVSSDQLYSFWKMEPEEIFPGTFAEGIYLRGPAGFEVLGQGSLGADLNTRSHLLGAGGAHAIFSSKAHLEPEAAPEGTEAVYDRAAGAAVATVVSVKPDGSSFAAGEDASYVAATDDGAAVAFRVGGTLYLNDEGKSARVAAAPNVFAGVSEDGERVFYAAGPSGADPATLYACDLAAGPCAGAEPSGRTQIAADSVFANVSADGSRAFFSSEDVLTGSEESENGEVAEAGKDNLYAWDRQAGATSFVAQLAPADGGFGQWTAGVNPGRGQAAAPTRSSPDGAFLVFESQAQLTPYDNEGYGEIYRYAPSAPSGERLLCVSCDPSGAPPGGDAILQDTAFGSGVLEETLITNVTDDGDRVFFQSSDRLMPDDANAVLDVYRWRAQGNGCGRTGGCLALISSGKGEGASYLYSMSADGHDVFFRTREKLVGPDVAGSPSIYDARVEGGIPDPPAPEPCQGDACQGQGTTPPALSAPDSPAAGDGNVAEVQKPRPCPKGKRKVRRAGKVRCVKRRGKRQGKRSPARADRDRRKSR